MKSIQHLAVLAAFGIFAACEPAEQQPEGGGDDANNSGSDNKTKTAETQGSDSPTEPVVAKLQDVEKRDKEGNIVGLLEEGLWYKRGADEPYTGLVVGANKPKNGEPPVTPYNYRREFKQGLQVGKETSWYANGKKRIEMDFENGEVVSTRKWDADGNEIK